MNALSTEPVAQPALTDADRARARLNRIAPRPADADSPFGDRRRDPDARQTRRHGTGRRGGFRLGWGGWLLIELGAVGVVAAAVLVWPPASACRDQEAKLGFYAGETLGKCIRRGVADRIDAVDQYVKMALRGSGK